MSNFVSFKKTINSLILRKYIMEIQGLDPEGRIKYCAPTFFIGSTYLESGYSSGGVVFLPVRSNVSDKKHS